MYRKSRWIEIPLIRPAIWKLPENSWHHFLVLNFLARKFDACVSKKKILHRITFNYPPWIARFHLLQFRFISSYEASHFFFPFP